MKYSEDTKLQDRAFPSFLRQLRLDLGCSQEVFAARLGCSRLHISRLENGRRHPDRLFLRAIAREFSLTNEQMQALQSFEIEVIGKHYWQDLN